jgi:hypothetical protein
LIVPDADCLQLAVRVHDAPFGNFLSTSRSHNRIEPVQRVIQQVSVTDVADLTVASRHN